MTLPCPPEVDVFSIPHQQMKALVGGTLDRVDKADFKNPDDFDTLLDHLMVTFSEFKRHEAIENFFIVRTLRNKLRALSVFEDAVFHCHEDSQLRRMTELLEEGYHLVNKADGERIGYGERLRRAIKDFTEVFIPHMAEEEEIFQPLLVKYFAYEELLSLRSSVIRSHIEKSDAFTKEIVLTPSSSEPEDEIGSPKRNVLIKEKKALSVLPRELWAQVLSHLRERPRDILKCAVVCKSFNELLFSPADSRVVWSTIVLADFLPHRTSCERVKREILRSCDCRLPLKLDAFLDGFVDSFLKRVGEVVTCLDFSGWKFGDRISSLLVRNVLEWTPNVVELDLSQCSAVSAMVFQNPSRLKLANVKRVNFADCVLIGDRALRSFVQALSPSTELGSLNLSGCCTVTDQGLNLLRPFVSKLEFLELSGLHRLTGRNLSEFVYNYCPRLSPVNLYYCDNVEGPYPAEACGCQNLGSCDSCCCRSF